MLAPLRVHLLLFIMKRFHNSIIFICYASMVRKQVFSAGELGVLVNSIQPVSTQFWNGNCGAVIFYRHMCFINTETLQSESLRTRPLIMENLNAHNHSQKEH